MKFVEGLKLAISKIVEYFTGEGVRVCVCEGVRVCVCVYV